MKQLVHIFGVLFLLTIFSCDKSSPDCFKKAGTQTSLIREVAPFANVMLESNVEVILKHGTEYKAEIIGPKNLIDKVETSVSSNTLTIDNHNGCNFVRGYKHHLKVVVTCPRYNRVISNSIGNIVAEKDLVQDSLFVYTEGGDLFIDGTFDVLKTGSHGNGNVYFKGTTNRLFVYMNGTNFFYGQDGVINTYVFVENISLGDAYINAPVYGYFDYHIWRTGNVFYKGDPLGVNGKREKSGAAVKQ